MSEKRRFCVFCDTDKCEKDLFFSSHNFSVVFDRFPCTPGHVLIVPKRHVVSKLDLFYPETVSIIAIERKIIEKLNDTDLRAVYAGFVEDPYNDASKKFCEDALAHPNIDGGFVAYNYGGNEGIEAGRTVDHMHMHIFPRTARDKRNARGGVRKMFFGKGSY